MAIATLAQHSRSKKGPITSRDLMEGSPTWDRLSKERREIYIGAREFSEKQLAPKTIDLHKGIVTLSAIDGLKEYRMLGVPAKYGGLEGHEGVVDAVMVHENLAYGSPSAAAERDGNSLFMDSVLLGGNEGQKEKFVTDVASGIKTGCFGLTDPKCGSNVGGMKTLHFEKVDGLYLLNGSKTFITNGPIADYAVVFANDTDNPQIYRNLTAFIVPRAVGGSPGFTSDKHIEKIGWRASDTSEIRVDYFKAKETDVLGKVGGAISIIVNTLSYGRLKIAAEALGMMERIYDEVVKFAQDREIEARVMLKDSHVFQWQLADLDINFLAPTRDKIYNAAFLAETWVGKGDERRLRAFAEDATRAKIFATENLKKMAAWGVNMHGGYGFTLDYAVSVIYENAIVYPTVEGATNPLMIAHGAWLAGGK